ncbi:Hypothetical predicted protein [Paramuricea clavata]|uniref:Uncharacterized protein n=1 Tax=Paramuricea clavata TaxID=317549 RepID=A0A7D9HQ97_PARCT|nr:Hypothetical predicted protein [Paramuricea clavata]
MCEICKGNFKGPGGVATHKRRNEKCKIDEETTKLWIMYVYLTKEIEQANDHINRLLSSGQHNGRKLNKLMTTLTGFCHLVSIMEIEEKGKRVKRLLKKAERNGN